MEKSPELDNQQERREAAIRLAAFFEGEGTFIVSVFRKSTFYHCTPVIRVGNCDPKALKEMIRILDMFQVGHRVFVSRKYSDKHAQVAVLGIEGFKRVGKFLDHFGDFFFGRKQTNVALFRKYLPLIMLKNHRIPEERVVREVLVTEFRSSNMELNKLGVSRFLNDYTPSTQKSSEDIV